MFNYYKDAQISTDRHQRLLIQAEQERLVKGSQPARSWELGRSFRKVLANVANLLLSDGAGKGSFANYYSAGLGGARG